MLRQKAASSPVDDLVAGHFREVLDDAEADPGRIRRVLLCGGKIYYDLASQRAKANAGHVAIVRVEQFYPVPEDLLAQVVQRYGKATEWVWVQEESQNMGAWTFLEPRLQALGQPFEYVGRDASASPATGSHEVHVREQREVVEAAVSGNVPHLVRASGPIRPRPALADGSAPQPEKVRPGSPERAGPRR
jgi:2-oxoglutarate dehydrogenase E1 component